MQPVNLIECVLGHGDVEIRFADALAQGRLHHAWLLYGLQGIGKACLAQHLAARYLCETPAKDHMRACGQCHSCRMLQSGAHPDYVFVGKEEKKRDVSIAQVREVLAFLALAGRESEKRVVVLDDANRMNLQAANAVLKGLEEPTPGSLLLIVCHDLIRMPATIRSRCMLEHCSLLPDTDIDALLLRQKMPEDIVPLARSLAQGCPGNVMALQDKSVARACMAWQALIRHVATANVADVQTWLQKHVIHVPHEMVAAIVYSGVMEEIMVAHKVSVGEDFARRETMLQALQYWLAWPNEVERHSLRAAATAFSRFLTLRSAVKGMASG